MQETFPLAQRVICYGTIIQQQQVKGMIVVALYIDMKGTHKDLEKSAVSVKNNDEMSVTTFATLPLLVGL